MIQPRGRAGTDRRPRQTADQHKCPKRRGPQGLLPPGGLSCVRRREWRRPGSSVWTWARGPPGAGPRPSHAGEDRRRADQGMTERVTDVLMLAPGQARSRGLISGHCPPSGRGGLAGKPKSDYRRSQSPHSNPDTKWKIRSTTIILYKNIPLILTLGLLVLALGLLACGPSAQYNAERQGSAQAQDAPDSTEEPAEPTPEPTVCVTSVQPDGASRDICYIEPTPFPASDSMIDSSLKHKVRRERERLESSRSTRSGEQQPTPSILVKVVLYPGDDGSAVVEWFDDHEIGYGNHSSGGGPFYASVPVLLLPSLGEAAGIRVVYEYERARPDVERNPVPDVPRNGDRTR